MATIGRHSVRERRISAEFARLAAMERFITSDGTPVAYEYDDSAPAGMPPVVLLHGFALSSQLSWGASSVADAFADAGRRTVQIDLRGHGESGGPDDARAYGEQRMAQDVREVLDQLGLERYDLLGHSIGAITALLLAASDPRVRRVVVSGIGGAAVELGGVDTREIPGDLIAEGLRADDPSGLAHPFSQAWRSFVNTVEGNRAALAHQALAMHAAPLGLEQITAPTLVLVGTDDNLARNPGVLAGAIQGARLQLIPGADQLDTVLHERYAPSAIAFLAES